MTNILDLFRHAEEQGYGVYWCPNGHPDLESFSVEQDGDCDIAIDPGKVKSLADLKYKLGHELAHCDGGFFYNPRNVCDLRERYEVRADRKCFRRLLPRDELYAALRAGLQTWEIAEMFTMPEPVVIRAMEYYKMMDAS